MDVLSRKKKNRGGTGLQVAVQELGGGAVQELGQPTVELSLRQTPTGLLKTRTNHFGYKDLYWEKRKYSH